MARKVRGRPVAPEPEPERYDEAAALAARAPVPAVVGTIFTGTAGWTDPSLVKSGRFYPSGSSSAEARLRHYASQFNLVEVDATYYALLSPDVSRRWVEWTTPEFQLDVKAHPVLTGHPMDVGRLPGDLKAVVQARDLGPRVYPDRLPVEIRKEVENRFFEFVEPLVKGGRLGCVMLQFPPWFRATRGNARRLEALREQFPAIPFAVELRHSSWLAESRRARLFDLLEAARMSYVAVDEPNVAYGGVPPITAVTDPELAIVRFHGQNAGGWRRGASVAERFDYLYRPNELRAWVGPVRQLADGARRVHAVFNNCVRDYAVLNAKGLAVLLEAPASPAEGQTDGVDPA
jgi:uncharacterized protein YecE (DUF72 family)